jgi:hypothetical protein
MTGMKHRASLLTLSAAALVWFALAVPAHAASSDQTGSTPQSSAVKQHHAAKKKHQRKALEAKGGARAEHNMKAVEHGEKEDAAKKGESTPPSPPTDD